MLTRLFSTPYTRALLTLRLFAVTLLSLLMTVAHAQSTPPAPTLTAAASNGQVALSWNQTVTPGTSQDVVYWLYRGTSPGGEGSSYYTALYPPYGGKVAPTTYTDTAVTNGTTYYYQVVELLRTQSGNAEGLNESPPSNEANATPHDPSLLSVSGLTLSPASVFYGGTSTGTVTLSGPAPSGGQTVSLSSSNAVATITPTSLSVPTGSTTATFTVTTGNAPSPAVTSMAVISAACPGTGAQQATLTIAPRFQITGINNGDTLSGDTTVTIAVYDTSINDSDVWLSIDGQQVDSGEAQPQTDGSYAITVLLQTNDYPNGSHTIQVADNRANSDTRQVTFSNSISNIVCGAIFDVTPNETDVPATCQITATLDTPQQWQVAIQDLSGNTVRSFSGNGSSINVTWDGTNGSGVLVGDDSYGVVLTASGTGQNAQPTNDDTSTSPQFTSPGGASPQPQSAGSPPVTRPVVKDSIGDSLIVINVSAIAGGFTKAASYASFIKSEVGPKVGTDFTVMPHVMLTSDEAMNGSPAERIRINNKLREIPLNLIYVYTHGEDVVLPCFRIGIYYWYTYIPPYLIDGIPANQKYDVERLVSGLSYGDINTPLD